MLDFSMIGLILTCLKIIGASIIIGITTFIVLLVAAIIWIVLKDMFEKY